MKQLFWGYFFLYFDFQFALNKQYILQLLPDFVGFLLLYRGLGELSAESRRFTAARPFAVGLGVYTALLWAGDLLGLSGAAGRFLGISLDVLYTLVFYYVNFLLVSAIRETEQAHSANLCGESLQKLWLAMLVARLLSYFSYLLSPVQLLCGVVGFVLSIGYLINIHRAWKQYELLPLRTGSETTQ